MIPDGLLILLHSSYILFSHCIIVICLCSALAITPVVFQIFPTVMHLTHNTDCSMLITIIIKPTMFCDLTLYRTNPILRVLQTLPLSQSSGQVYHQEYYYSHVTDEKQRLRQVAAAKSLQSCPTLCDPIDGSPPGSPIPGILQARTLEWVAIFFSNA